MSAQLVDQLARLAVTVICEPDEQGQFLTRELQRTRARVTHLWPMPERIGQHTDILLCEFSPDFGSRLAWMPGEPTAASIILLPQSGRFDMDRVMAAAADAVLHRPYRPDTVISALGVALDHFSYGKRQRNRIARLEENIRSLRHIERAKLIIMANRKVSEHDAFNMLRSLAMKRRMTIAALSESMVDSDDNAI